MTTALSILAKLLDWVPYLGLYLKGRLDARRAWEAAKAKTLEKQLEIANRPPDSPDAILDRMRRGGL